MFKYPKINNIAELTRDFAAAFNDDTYAVTEKIHGANTSCEYDIDLDTYTYYSRNNQILYEDSFYGVQNIFDSLRPKFKHIGKMLKEVDKDISRVLFFGEVFGGNYPHPEVGKIPGAKMIQRGVYYSAQNHWKCFDIFACHPDLEYFPLSQSMMFHLTGAVDLPTVPILAVCNSLKEALKYPNDGESIVYKDYGLPKIEDNIMEGVVIKSWSGKDISIYGTRAIFKNKNVRFSEKAKTEKIKALEDYPEEIKTCLEKCMVYINENRVHSAMSKIGECTPKSIGVVIKDTMLDALEDIKKEVPEFNTLDNGQQNIVTRALTKEAAGIVKKEIYSLVKEME
jgi:Rnl2 family RNA ligase